MGTTAGFFSLDWSRNHLGGLSNCSWRCHFRRRSPGGIFCPQTLEMFWPILQQPTEIWTNGCYGWIQQVKRSRNNFERSSDYSWQLVYKGKSDWPSNDQAKKMHFLWQQIMYCIGNWLTLIKHIKVEFYKLKLVNLSLSFMFWLCFHFRRSERLVAHTVNLVPNDQRKSRISSDNKSCMVLAIDSRLESIAL